MYKSFTKKLAYSLVIIKFAPDLYIETITMSREIKIKRGKDIKLVGSAEKIHANGLRSETVALKPSDFIGIRPKMLVKEGDVVKAGTPIFFDKNNEELKFVSPVSGKIAEIKRGAKRVILEVIITADSEIAYEKYEVGTSLSSDKVKELMLSSGLWPMVRQRPFDVIANPKEAPKAIFISAFDSSPLAPDYDFILHGQSAAFQAGIDAIAKLTTGKVHLNINGATRADEAFTAAKGVQLNKFVGPHPAGNVGVQIHQLEPLSKGETIWFVNPQDVVTIGKFFISGQYDASRIVALAGSEVTNAKYYRTVIGASAKSIFTNNVKEGSNRYISGNVLTGTRIEMDGYLGFYDHQFTVIPENHEPELFGWIMPNFGKWSNSRALFSWLMPNKEYKLDSKMNGEERAFVVTGQYEEVFPFDIYPQQLIKSIMIDDIEAMEELGIYEVAPEDFALCEVVCTSKLPLQSTVRKGLEKLRIESL